MVNNKLRIKKAHLMWGLLALIFIIAFFIIRPFIVAIISAYILAFLLVPVFKFFNRKLNRGFSALFSVILLLVLIIVPLFLIVSQIVHEATVLSQNINVSSLNFSLGFNNIGNITSETIKPELSSYASNLTSNLIKSFPSVLITLLVTFFGTFYFLYDWKEINDFLYRKAPFENKKSLFEDISKTTKRITYGLLLVGFLEFSVSFIGFTISGVKFPLLLALMIGILAFTLVVDPSIVWLPTALFYFFVLHRTGTAIGVIITGLIISTDVLFRPKIIGSVSKINPFIMLLGVLGGIALFGVLGFIVGPVVLFFTMRLFRESFEIK